ncbi:MAG: pyridoxal phosphate-dependent aminotransferase [Desulfobacterales bacterium]|nr:pyridoxal phosphate-dependent aminotransferase [Desulfobacterales bacterium]
MRLNQKLQAVWESATVALADRVRELKAEGKHVIALQTGDPDFPTPEPIVEAAYQALKDGLTHYSNSRGLPELREAISQKLFQEHGVHYDPGAEILVTSGGVHAYFCALNAILSLGEEVLVPDPAWMTHSNVITLLGGKAKHVPSEPENDFWPKVDAWEESVSPKTVALVINSPNNPTGSVATEDYLRKVVDFANRHDLHIISDEVYNAILFDSQRHVCMASFPEARDRILLVNSFSKTYAMTGWRIGYLAAPAAIVSQALKASQHTITNVSPFVQKAALCALNDADVAAAVSKMVARYQQRRDMALKILKERSRVGIDVVKSKGAFYLFLDIRKLGMPSNTFAKRLLDEALISTVPGSVYGVCGEGFLRVTTATSEEVIEAGIQGLLDWADSQEWGN